MTIKNIAEDLNQALSESLLRDFQVNRAARLGNSKPGSRYLFSKRTIHERYAYHDGGRSELQFNIAFEDAKFFRYGIALSLQQGRSLLDPISSMEGRVRKLNELIRNNPALFRGLKMWRSQAGARGKIRSVEQIPATWVIKESFIFIGKRKKVSGRRYRPTSAAIRKIVELFERLNTVYEAVENEEMSPGRYRAARIVWNNQGWKHPSGPEGKVRRKKNFEHINGFGLEEWIFDDSHLVGDWHYSFLQCFGHYHNAYSNKTFDVLLYARDDRTKERVWVGRIMNITCLDDSQSKKALGIYKNKGWLTQMAEEVDRVGGDSTHLKTAKPLNIINCKFRISDLEIFDEPRPRLSQDDQHIKALYYDTFTNIPSHRFFKPQSPQTEKATTSIPADLSKYGSDGMKARRTKKWSSSKNEKQAELRHKSWQAKLLCTLREKYGKRNVGVEVPAGTGYADVVLHVGGLTIIIELKTGNSTKQLVREALGQVIEYGFWPGLWRSKCRFVVSGESRLDSETANYLEFLRERFGIPIWYLRYRAGSLESLEDVLVQQV